MGFLGVVFLSISEGFVKWRRNMINVKRKEIDHYTCKGKAKYLTMMMQRISCQCWKMRPLSFLETPFLIMALIYWGHSKYFVK